MQKTVVWLALCAAVVLAGAAGAEDKGKGGKLDPAKLVGTWKYVSAAKGDDKKSADDLKGQKVIFTKDKLTLEGDTGKFVMKYDIDATKTPATIKLEMTESPFGAGATAAGIVALDGDDLKFCYVAMGDAPKKFEATGDARLCILRRSK